MFLKRLLLTVVLVLLSLSMLSQAQDTAEVEPVLLIGSVTDEPDIFVGLVIEGETATLYICDGQADKGTVSIAQWFVGTAADHVFDVTAANGNRVEVALTESSATGKITFTDGTVKEFTLAPGEGAAALHRADFAFGEDEYVAGWLVLADGSVRGSVFIKDTEKLVPASFESSIIAILIGKKEIRDGTSN